MTVVHYGLTWPKDPCQVWVEFEGKSKIWIPKSITIRKLIMEPEYFPVTENLNSISFPIIKFYFDGVLSLTESYGIHKLRPKGPYQVRKIVDPILSLQITSDKIIKFPKLVLDIERIPDIPIEKVERSISFSEEFFRQFIENNLWLSSIYHPIYSNYTRNCINSIHLLTNHLTHF